MSFRNKVSALVFSALLSFACLASASPASDVLAKEDAIALPMVVSIVNGSQDFSQFKNVVDAKRLKLDELKNAKKSVAGLAKVDKVSFAGFERNGAFDRVTYLAVDGNTPKAIIGILFDPQTNLAVGIMAGDVQMRPASQIK